MPDNYYPFWLPAQEVEEANAILEALEVLMDDITKDSFREDLDRMKLHCEKYIEKYNKAFNAI